MDRIGFGASSAVPSLVLPLLLAGWLSTDHAARLICDAQQKILWHCPDLLQRLHGQCAIRVERDQLLLSDKRAQAALSDFMQDAAAPDTAIWLGGEDDDTGLILQCRRLEVPPFVTAFGLRIVKNHDRPEREFRHFAEHFGLTRQEAAVCQFLLAGNTVQDIVASEAKSPDTVRFHVRNIYNKLGVSSREALFAKLRLFQFT